MATREVLVRGKFWDISVKVTEYIIRSSNSAVFMPFSSLLSRS